MMKRAITLLLALVLCVSLAIPAAAGPGLVRDYAGLLDTAEQAQLESRLQQLSQHYNTQICIYTMDHSAFASADNLAEYIYDEEDLGYGDSKDGILLLVCMNLREFRILSNGSAAAAITMDVIGQITESITPELTGRAYADAFATFADACEYHLEGHKNGYPFDAATYLVLALVLGILVGLIVAFVLKGQLRSVRRQNQADVYVRPGSLEITRARDIFLYRTVTRTAKPQNSGRSRSGGGGGGSRNIGGGRF